MREEANKAELKISYDCGDSKCGAMCETCESHTDMQPCKNPVLRAASLLDELERITGNKYIPEGK